MFVNLNKDFKPFGGVTPNIWEFPSAAEFGVKIDESWFTRVFLGNTFNDSITIVARLNSSQEIIKLLLLTDALKKYSRNIELRVSYLPYGRQDRLCDTGESFSLKIIADLINTQQYTRVEIFDPHSDVTPALINNSIAISNHKFVAKALKDEKNYLLVSPDAGAFKKIFNLACHLNYTDEIVCCNKVRNVTTGKIKKMSVMSDTDLAGRRCIIVDDIISKGGTFVGLAKELKIKGAKQVDLIVSHHENSADKEVLKSELDHIYTTNSFCDISSDEFTTQLPISHSIW
jgi:ribose-phosphate pyrophosphokinase